MKPASTPVTTRGAASTRGAPTGAPTTADLVVLSLLCERQMHGYELLKEYQRQQVQDWAAVSRPHVYYALKKLARQGLIERGGDGDRRGKTVYRVRARGRAALTKALSALSWAHTRTPTAFDTWLGLSVHAHSADRRRVLAARRAYLEEQITLERRTLEGILADKGERTGVAQIMVGLCIEQFETELRWLARLERSLAG